MNSFIFLNNFLLDHAENLHIHYVIANNYVIDGKIENMRKISDKKNAFRGLYHALYLMQSQLQSRNTHCGYFRCFIEIFILNVVQLLTNSETNKYNKHTLNAC